MHKPTATDAFNMLAGAKLGSGCYRDVFECKIRPDLVVKVEIPRDSGYRTFANVAEMKFWDDHEFTPEVKKWLARCEFLSPDGLILLQERVTPATEIDLARMPNKLPAFLTDRKPDNYGWTKDGRFVCCDYAMTIKNPSLRMTRADW